MKTKIIKLGDGCNLTVTIIDRQGMPLKLATLKSLVISLVSDRSQNLSFTANRDNTLTIALTYASNLTKTGMYQIRVEGELSDGQAFDYTEQIIEVKDFPESTETTFITSLVLRDVHNVTEKEIQDVNYKKLGYEAFSPFKAYTTADVVVFGGSLYKFTANKSAGIWNADNVEETSFAELIGQGGTSFEDLGYEPFSETEDYAIDDVVIYDGSLYKFTAAHTGAWSGTDAEATSVEKLIKEGGGGNGHSPYIGDNGNWFEWDDDTKQFVDTGTKAQGEDGAQGNTGPQGPQGPQGNTGSSVDYPFELVNNLTTDDETKALSAAQGKVLDGKLTELDEVINGEQVLSNRIDGYYLYASIIVSAAVPNADANWTYCPTFVPIKNGDVIDVYFGINGSANHACIILYNDDESSYNQVSYFSTNGYTNSRTTVITEDKWKFARFAFGLANINDCYVKINGNYVWKAVHEVGLISRVNAIDADVKSIKARIGKETKLSIGEVVQGSDTKNGIVVETYTNRVCQKSVSCIPYMGVTFKFKLPSTIKAVVLSGKVAGSNLLNTDSGWITNGMSYKIPDGNIFYRIHFADANDSSANISPSDVASKIESEEIVVTYTDKDVSVVERNLENTKYAKAASLNLEDGNNQIGNMLDKLMVFAHISDLHGDKQRFINCMEYAKHFGVDAVVNSGDSVPYHFGNGNSWQKEVCEMYPNRLITCIGNHEVWHSVAGNNATIFAEYIQPYVDDNDYLAQANTPATSPYYFCDFASKKIRVITLNQYDCSIYGGQNRGGKLGQSQVSWFVDTLRSTPAEYGVVIVMHAHEGKITRPSSLDPFNQQVFVGTYMNNGFYTNAMRPIMKIVDAFIDRTTLSTSFTESNNDGTAQNADTITINADFSSVDASTEFICYLCGHRHEDYVGYYEDSPRQLVITVTSGCAHYGTSNTHAALANQEDIPRGTFGPTQDAFNIVAIDRVNGLVKLARVGSNVTFQLTERKYISIPYRITHD